ncbi:MAG TPA: hypothetical protein PLN61_14640 [bacterium]|nr:hypothetical protein [bacterium]
MAATVREFTAGTQCPCMISRDSAVPTYSADWHRRNPAAEACNGTGMIGETTVETAVKTIPMDAQAIGNLSNLIKQGGSFTDIGNIDVGDYLLYGAVRTSTGALFSFESLGDKNVITLLGKTYAIKETMLVPVGGTVVSMVLVKRVS